MFYPLQWKPLILDSAKQETNQNFATIGSGMYRISEQTLQISKSTSRN